MAAETTWLTDVSATMVTSLDLCNVAARCRHLLPAYDRPGGHRPERLAELSASAGFRLGVNILEAESVQLVVNRFQPGVESFVAFVVGGEANADQLALCR